MKTRTGFKYTAGDHRKRVVKNRFKQLSDIIIGYQLDSEIYQSGRNFAVLQKKTMASLACPKQNKR